MNKPSIPPAALLKLRDPFWLFPVLAGIIAGVWGAGQAYAGLQNETDVEKAIKVKTDPLAKGAEKLESEVDANHSEFTGFKLKMTGDISALGENVDNLAQQQDKQDKKLDNLLIITVEQRELARPQVNHQTRARARRAAARVRIALEEDADDPLGGL